MKKWLILTVAAAACSGAEASKTPDPEMGGADVVAQCNAAAEVAKKEADLYRNVTPSSLDAATAAYEGFHKTITKWEAEDAPCAREGADVTARVATQQEVSKVLAEAESEGTAKLIRHLEPNVDMARDFLKVVFASGRKPSDTVIDAATSVDRRYRERLMTKFNETKKLGQLDDKLATTCIFGDMEIDPKVEPIRDNFKSIFSGKTEVNVLCRLPLTADKYGGDPGGKFVLVLDEDDDPNNGTVAEVDLGAPEKWSTSQYFKGRFTMPQGKAFDTKADAGYYHVWLTARRPKMGDESPAHNWFYWHR